MTNKLVVIINSLKEPKIKKILLYEMKFLVPNYSCLQNPWLGSYRPQIPVLSVLCPQLNLLNPPWKKFVGMPLLTISMFHTSLCRKCMDTLCNWLFVSLKQIWNDPSKFHGNITLNVNVIQITLAATSGAFLKSVFTSGTLWFYFFFYRVSERRICDQ